MLIKSKPYIVLINFSTSQEKKGEIINTNDNNNQNCIRNPYLKEKKSISLTKKIPSMLKNKSLENTLMKSQLKK